MQSFDLSQVFFGMTLSNWIETIHDKMVTNYGMDKFFIEPNDFAYDAYASVIVLSLIHI